MTGLNPVLRPKSDGFLKMTEGIIRIALEAINSGQGVMNVFLIGGQFIRLVEILEGLLQVTAVERRDSTCVASLRGLGTAFLMPFAFAKTYMNLCSVRYLTDRPRGEFLEKLRGSCIISFLKVPDRGSKILQRCFALYIWRAWNRYGNRPSAVLGPRTPHRVTTRSAS